ncbi:MAG: MBL fold metallo-hydrolase, partial [Chloroflexi bacterium]|nr:MBL fold metallo-hydrolase [Chloroflexota bacterium]
MPIATTLRFLGGAGSVTGSRFLFESQGERILVDCGLFQEREFASRNWDRFPVPPESITAVVLTHAHLDHCGYLPKLVRDGFHGRVYCTSGTRDIARVVLEDSGRIQEEDAGYKLKRHRREGRTGRYPEAPLYTADDARRVRDLFAPVRYGRSFRASPHITATFRDAGHILGSSTIELRVDLGDPGVRTIIFSGDLGRVGKPLHDDPE